jgi:hypothetical protein
MRLIFCEAVFVPMLVMFVVGVTVIVLDGIMPMLMYMLFGEMHKNANAH